MVQNARIASLLARKVQIETELEQESSRRKPDMIRLATLKRRKLFIKEELSQLAGAA